MNDSSSSELRTGNVYRPDESTHNSSPSKLKTYGFIIAIIVGVGGLAVGGAGVAGYFHVGALSNLAQIDAIIMMAVGGGGGVILLIVGIIGTVKNRQPVSHQLRNGVNSGHRSASQKTESTQKTGNISSVDTQGGLVYGPEAWSALGKKWSCQLKILDAKIPNAPEKDVAEGRVRIYIPQKVSVNGEEKDFTLNNLIEMGGGPFEYCSDSVKDQFGNATASGWIEIDRGVIQESRSKNYDTQKDMVEKKGCRMPSVLEAVVLNLMVFAFTGERLYGEEPLTYTRCSEKVDGKYPVVVGGFDFDGLHVISYHFTFFDFDSYGVAALWKF
jgi:hypothetical protein